MLLLTQVSQETLDRKKAFTAGKEGVQAAHTSAKSPLSFQWGEIKEKLDLATER